MKQPRLNKIPAPKAAKDIVSRQKKENETSRRRLLGGVVLLLILTIVLVKITSNIKPLPINPNVIDIKPNEAESNNAIIANQTNASAPIAATNTIESNSQTTIQDNNPELILNDEQQPTDGFKAGVVGREQNKKMANNITATNNLVAESTIKKAQEIKPVIAVTDVAVNNNKAHITTTPTVKETVVAKPVVKVKPSNNPEDILNSSDDGDLLSTAIKNKSSNQDSKTTTAPSSGNKEYIQLAALSSAEKANALKQELAGKGVNATIQTIETSKGTLYRLKAGPYNSDIAKAKLQQLNSSGYSGIITTK